MGLTTTSGPLAPRDFVAAPDEIASAPETPAKLVHNDDGSFTWTMTDKQRQVPNEDDFWSFVCTRYDLDPSQITQPFKDKNPGLLEAKKAWLTPAQDCKVTFPERVSPVAVELVQSSAKPKEALNPLDPIASEPAPDVAAPAEPLVASLKQAITPGMSVMPEAMQGVQPALDEAIAAYEPLIAELRSASAAAATPADKAIVDASIEALEQRLKALTTAITGGDAEALPGAVTALGASIAKRGEPEPVPPPPQRDPIVPTAEALQKAQPAITAFAEKHDSAGYGIVAKLVASCKSPEEKEQLYCALAQLSREQGISLDKAAANAYPPSAFFSAILVGANDETLAAAEAEAATFTNPGMKKEYLAAIRMRHAEKPGGPLEGETNAAVREEYRRFVGPTCDGWMKELGISEEDVALWMRSPPGTEPPESIKKAIEDTNSGKATDASLNFLTYGLRVIAARHPGVKAINDLQLRILGAGVERQKGGAATLEAQARGFDAKAKELEAAGKTEEAKQYRAMAKTQRDASKATRTGVANMYKKTIEAYPPGEAPAYARHGHTQMAAGIIRTDTDAGNAKVEEAVYWGKFAEQNNSDARLAETKLPTEFDSDAPNGADGWKAKAIELDPDAINNKELFDATNRYEQAKQQGCETLFKIRQHTGSTTGMAGVTPPLDPETMKIYKQGLDALIAQGPLLTDRLNFLLTQKPYSPETVEQMLTLKGQLQRVALAERTLCHNAELELKTPGDLEKERSATEGQINALDEALYGRKLKNGKREGGLENELFATEKEYEDASEEHKPALKAKIDELNRKLTAGKANLDDATFTLEKIRAIQANPPNPIVSETTEAVFNKTGNFPELYTKDDMTGEAGRHYGVRLPRDQELFEVPNQLSYEVNAAVLPGVQVLDGATPAGVVMYGKAWAGDAQYWGTQVPHYRGKGNDPTARGLELSQRTVDLSANAGTALGKLDPKSPEAQELAPVVTFATADASGNIAPTSPDGALQVLGVSEQGANVFNFEAVDPKKPDGSLKTPDEINDERFQRYQLDKQLDGAVQQASMVVVKGMQQASPYKFTLNDKGQWVKSSVDFDTMRTGLNKALELLDKMDPPPADAAEQRAYLKRVSNLVTALIGLSAIKSAKDKQGTADAKTDITVEHHRADNDLEGAVSILGDVAIDITPGALDIWIAADPDIKALAVEAGYPEKLVTFGDIREKMKQKTLNGELSQLDKELARNLDACEQMGTLFAEAGKQGKEFGIFKLLSRGNIADMQKAADDMGLKGKVDCDKIFSWVHSDTSGFKEILFKGKDCFGNMDMDVEKFGDKLNRHQGSSTSFQDQQINDATKTWGSFRQDMVPVKIAVGAGELVVGIVLPGAALRTLGTAWRMANVGKTALVIARVGGTIERGREAAMAVKTIKTVATFGKNTLQAIKTFEQSGALASITVKMFSGVALNGVNRVIMYGAKEAGIDPMSFGGKLLAFSTNFIGATGQNKIARFTELGGQLILPGLQFVGTTFVIPAVWSNPEDQELANGIMEWGVVPMLGALHGAHSEQRAINRSDCEAGAGAVNQQLREAGFREVNQTELTNLLYEGTKLTSADDVQTHMVRLENWGKEQGMPTGAIDGLKRQGAVAFASRSLEPRENWGKAAPTPEAIHAKYEKIVGDLMTADPTMPREVALNTAKEILSTKISASLPKPAANGAPAELSGPQQKNKEALDQASKTLLQDHALDVAATRSINDVSGVTPQAERFVRESLVPDLMGQMRGEKTVAREDAKAKLVEAGMTGEAADILLDKAIDTVAGQVSDSQSMVQTEGASSAALNRINYEAALTKLNVPPEVARVRAAERFGTYAGIEAVNDTQQFLGTRQSPMLSGEQSKLAAQDVGTAVTEYAKSGGDMDAFASGLQNKLESRGLSKVQAEAITNNVVGKLVTENAIAAANGSGPGLPRDLALGTPEQRQTFVAKSEEGMRASGRFGEPEIAASRESLVREFVMQDARKSLTPEDGTATALAKRIHESAVKNKELFPELNPEQLVADVAIDQTVESMMGKVTPEQMQKDPGVEKQLIKLVCEQFGLKEKDVSTALARRKERSKEVEKTAPAVATPVTTPVAPTVDAEGTLISAQDSSKPTPRKTVDVTVEEARPLREGETPTPPLDNTPAPGPDANHPDNIPTRPVKKIAGAGEDAPASGNGPITIPAGPIDVSSPSDLDPRIQQAVFGSRDLTTSHGSALLDPIREQMATSALRELKTSDPKAYEGLCQRLANASPEHKAALLGMIAAAHEAQASGTPADRNFQIEKSDVPTDIERPIAIAMVSGKLVPIFEKTPGKNGEIKVRTVDENGKETTAVVKEGDIRAIAGEPTPVAWGKEGARQTGYGFGTTKDGGGVLFDPASGLYHVVSTTDVQPLKFGITAVDIPKAVSESYEKARATATPDDLKQLDSFLSVCPTPTHQLMMLRAFGLHGSIHECQQFKELLAVAFPPKGDASATQLLQICTADGVVQYFAHSCVMTADQYQRAQASPLEALKLVAMGREGIAAEQGAILKELKSKQTPRETAPALQVPGMGAGRVLVNAPKNAVRVIGDGNGANMNDAVTIANRGLAKVVGAPGYKAIAGEPTQLLEGLHAVMANGGPPEGVQVFVENKTTDHALLVVEVRQKRDANGKVDLDKSEIVLRDPMGGLVIVTGEQLRTKATEVGKIEGIMVRTDATVTMPKDAPALKGERNIGGSEELPPVPEGLKEITPDRATKTTGEPDYAWISKETNVTARVAKDGTLKIAFKGPITDDARIAFIDRAVKKLGLKTTEIDAVKAEIRANPHSEMHGSIFELKTVVAEKVAIKISDEGIRSQIGDLVKQRQRSAVRETEANPKANKFEGKCSIESSNLQNRMAEQGIYIPVHNNEHGGHRFNTDGGNPPRLVIDASFGQFFDGPTLKLKDGTSQFEAFVGSYDDMRARFIEVIGARSPCVLRHLESLIGPKDPKFPMRAFEKMPTDPLAIKQLVEMYIKENWGLLPPDPSMPKNLRFEESYVKPYREAQVDAPEGYVYPVGKKPSEPSPLAPPVVVVDPSSTTLPTNLLSDPVAVQERQVSDNLAALRAQANEALVSGTPWHPGEATKRLVDQGITDPAAWARAEREVQALNGGESPARPPANAHPFKISEETRWEKFKGRYPGANETKLRELFVTTGQASQDPVFTSNQFPRVRDRQDMAADYKVGCADPNSRVFVGVMEMGPFGGFNKALGTSGANDAMRQVYGPVLGAYQDSIEAGGGSVSFYRDTAGRIVPLVSFPTKMPKEACEKVLARADGAAQHEGDLVMQNGEVNGVKLSAITDPENKAYNGGGRFAVATKAADSNKPVFAILDGIRAGNADKLPPKAPPAKGTGTLNKLSAMDPIPFDPKTRAHPNADAGSLPGSPLISDRRARRHQAEMMAKELGLDPKKVLADFDNANPVEEVTRLNPATELEPTLKNAIHWAAQNGGTVIYGESDIGNLGGVTNLLSEELGKEQGRKLADASVVKPILDIYTNGVSAKVREFGGEVHFFRKGGDEIGEVIILPKNLSPERRAEAIRAINLARVEAKMAVARYVETTTIKVGGKTVELRNIEHLKYLGNPDKAGAGITSSGVVVEIPTIRYDDPSYQSSVSWAVEDAMGRADRRVETKKSSPSLLKNREQVASKGGVPEESVGAVGRRLLELELQGNEWKGLGKEDIAKKRVELRDNKIKLIAQFNGGDMVKAREAVDRSAAAKAPEPATSAYQPPTQLIPALKGFSEAERAGVLGLCQRDPNLVGAIVTFGPDVAHALYLSNGEGNPLYMGLWYAADPVFFEKMTREGRANELTAQSDRLVAQGLDPIEVVKHGGDDALATLDAVLQSESGLRWIASLPVKDRGAAVNKALQAHARDLQAFIDGAPAQHVQVAPKLGPSGVVTPATSTDITRVMSAVEATPPKRTGGYAEDAPFGEVDAAFLKQAGLAPATKVVVADKTIYLSAPYDLGGGRIGRVAYVEDTDGKVSVRSFYRSNSQGQWHSASHFGTYGDPGWYGKGHGENGTSLPIEMQAAIASDSTPPVGLDRPTAQRAFYGALEFITAPEHVQSEWSQPSGNTASAADLPWIDIGGKPGVGKRPVNGEAHWVVPETFRFAPGAAPSFSQKPTKTFKVDLPRYGGKIDAMVYPSEDGKLSYLMFFDPKTRRVWVAQVEIAQQPVTSFGVPKQTIDVGDVTMPPLEYETQVPPGQNNIGPGRSGQYVNAWPYLRRFPFIQDFYAKNGIKPPD